MKSKTEMSKALRRVYRAHDALVDEVQDDGITTEDTWRKAARLCLALTDLYPEIKRQGKDRAALRRRLKSAEGVIGQSLDAMCNAEVEIDDILSRDPEDTLLKESSRELGAAIRRVNVFNGLTADGWTEAKKEKKKAE